MNAPSVRIPMVLALALLLGLVGVAVTADQSGVRAPLQPLNDRKPAPDFALQDASGKTVRLQEYHGRVVLLDFWATWCTGCKKEIPWFEEFQETFGARSFAVVGISLDEGGWKVLRPFLNDHKIPYRILLGDDATAQKYGIRNMPDTFLIDQHGRIAAVYRAGLVDKDDVAANIKAVLSKD
jgi:peroxiredoxin